MKVLVVVSHHRDNSLTKQVKDEFEKGLKESGHEVTTVDLFKEKFNPIFSEAEEPYWTKRPDELPEEIQRQIKRMQEHDAIAMIFPIYWFGMPAMMKGFIDCVWVHDFMYGTHRTHKIQKVLWMPLCAGQKDYYNSSGLTSALETTWGTGIASYCNIEKSRTKILHGVMDGKTDNVEQALKDGHQEGLEFGKW